MEGALSRRTLSIVRIAAYALCALLLIAGALAAFPYPDEGFYVLAAQSAFREGGFYEGAPFFHMPGSAIALAGLLPLVGTDATLLRLLLAGLSLAGIVLIGAVVRTERGPRAEAIFAVLMAASPYTLTTLPSIASYSAFSFCGLALCAGGLSMRSVRGAAVAGAGAGFATAVRIAYAPAALVVLLALLRRDGRRAGLAYLAAAACAVAALSGWWLLSDPVAAWHNVITAQVERTQWTPYLWQTSLWGNKLQVAASLLLHVLGAVSALLPLAWARWRPGRAAVAPTSGRGGPLLHALLWPTVLVHFVPTPCYLVYFASVAPIFFAVCAIAVSELGGPGIHRWVAAGAIVGLAPQDNVFVRGQPYPFAWVGEAAVGLHEQGWDRAARELRARIEPGAPVWSFDTSLVVQAGGAVLPGFEMSYFGFYPTATRAYAEERHILDLSLALEPLTTRRAAAVVASRRYTWDVLRHDPATRAALWRAICADYRPALEVVDARYGPIRVLLPRGETRPDPCCERGFSGGEGEPERCPAP